MTTEHDKKLFLPSAVPIPLLAAARSLRHTMTDAEQLLWHCLRRKQLGGFRFRRQHPFERYILDFYCCEVKIAIELDGGQHNEPSVRSRDVERTTFLATHGIQVLRFWNNEIFSNVEGVLHRIYDALTERQNFNAPPP